VTILEVATYEVSHRGGAMETVIQPILIPILLVLSAIKFALVAMYYMHLKNDSKLFSGVFVFPIIIAAVIIVGLIVLQAYHWAFATGG
jgi:heme/copper-type cytochrome/quinol oxidase subunit 4